MDDLVLLVPQDLQAMEMEMDTVEPIAQAGHSSSNDQRDQIHFWATIQRRVVLLLMKKSEH